MQLAFDIGNSAIKGGFFSGSVLHRTFRVAHDPAALALALEAELNSAVVEWAALSSVVPRSTEAVAELLAKRGLPLTIIRHDMRLPFKLAYDTPHTLGADRLSAAAAAWLRYGAEAKRSVVALDAGTAFTYEVVDRSGVYRGGTISPGPALMQRALNRGTAQLPEVRLELPSSVIGSSTVKAIQSGIMHGFVDSVRGLLRRIDEELGERAYVAATGGWSSLLIEHLDEIDTVDPHLVLDGVRRLGELNGTGAVTTRKPDSAT